MFGKKFVGDQGEELAITFLKKHNYTILERNFRIRNGEIDIIAIDRSEKEPVLAFIEVKTRNSHAFGLPLDSITHWKLTFLIRTAQVYKSTHQNLPDLMRIDAVSIYYDNGKPICDLVKNISE